MRKRKIPTSNNSFFVIDIDDYFNILTPKERVNLYGMYDQLPLYSVFHNGEFRKIFNLNGVSVLHYPCEVGEWFVLCRHASENCIEELSSFDKVMAVIES